MDSEFIEEVIRIELRIIWLAQLMLTITDCLNISSI